MPDSQPEGWTPAHAAQSWATPPEYWPAGVKVMSLEGGDMMGVDDDGRLYWDGKPVEVAKTFGLSHWQKIGAFLTVCAAIVGAGAAAVSAYTDWVRP